jgi:hypothetical protein
VTKAEQRNDAAASQRLAGGRWQLGLTAVLCGLLLAHDAQAGKTGKPGRRKSLATFSADYTSAPSYRYANLDAPSCLSELDRRKISYQRVAEARGVLAPLRIPDGVGGVIFRTALPRSKGRQSPWEVFDCRLVLALHDFSKILVAHHIDEVLIFSAWRPPSKHWKKGKLARRHPGALAIDLYKFRRRVPVAAPQKRQNAPGDGSPVEPQKGDSVADEETTKPPPAKAKTGTSQPPPSEGLASEGLASEWLNVKDDFHGKIGRATCAPGTVGPNPVTPQTVELRALVCETDAARIFTSMLTPNYDKPHFNHFHFEVTPEVKWRLLR